MVQFIKQEAEEKANEIRVAAEEVSREPHDRLAPSGHVFSLSFLLVSSLFFFF